jgi:PAS domain S-box-containing protein
MIQAESGANTHAPTGSDADGNPRPVLTLVEKGIETALNLVGVGVWEHLLPENRVICSDGIYHLVGVDPAVGRLQPNFWISRVHPDDAAAQALAFKDFVQGTDQVYEEIYRVRHEAGHYISVMARMRWVSRNDDSDGRCSLGFVMDVTARNEDIDRLREREERFRMSLSALHGVVYDQDLRTGKIERHGLKRVFGYEFLENTDEFGGWLTMVHPEDRGHVLRTVYGRRERGTNYELSYRVRHADGRWRHVRHAGTYHLGPDGRPIRALGVIEDVTEAQEQRQQLQLQAAIIDRLGEGVMLITRDGTILFANPAFEKLFGYGGGELKGRNALSLSFRSSANFEGLLRTVFEGTTDDRTSIIDLEGRRRDGSMCPIQCYFSSMMLGATRCVVAVATDVSERKQLEREVMQVATRVQQRIGSDLHDGLGQQLAGIAMMLQGLGQRVVHAGGSEALSTEVDEIVQLVNAAIRSTRSLARGLSPVRPSREGLLEGFEELVNQVLERYRIRVHMELSLPDEMSLDENTATNLYRIAQEGVLNAARHADATQIHLRLRVAGPDVELLVIDDGKGFDPLQFARGGMGLRIMRFRAQLIGGYLSVESRPGAGTTLRCRCPVKMSKEAA